MDTSRFGEAVVDGLDSELEAIGSNTDEDVKVFVVISSGVAVLAKVDEINSIFVAISGPELAVVVACDIDPVAASERLLISELTAEGVDNSVSDPMDFVS